MNDPIRPEMHCIAFRRAVGADPKSAEPQVLEHAAVCPACAQYRREMLSLDGLLHRALAIEVPETAAQPQPASVQAERTAKRRFAPWFALAASVVLATGIGFGLWTTLPRESLAVTVVEHLSHEPEAMVATSARVAPFALDEVLAKGGIRLRDGLQGVSYARSCPIRGHAVPHLVVQTERGPVTVLVMANEPLADEVKLDGTGLEGTIVPAGRGSIAIIGGGAAAVDEVRNRVLEAVEFLPADQ